MVTPTLGKDDRGGDIPNEPTSKTGKGIPFGIDAVEIETEFVPVYYPDRFTDTLETDVEKNSRQCKGQDVTVDTIKNPEFHATGIMLADSIEDFRAIRSHDGPVVLETPLTDNIGGMEVIVTKGEIGQINGWDAMYDQWQFNYTIDMVGSGSDAEETGENQILSDVISEFDDIHDDVAESNPF